MGRIAILFIISILLISTGCRDERPDVILIVIDALRADHLGCYGYERDTSPVLDSLAASGVRWSRVQAQAPWTLPGLGSIVSGLTPRAHGAREDFDNSYPLSPEMETAASILSEAGFYTIGILNCFWAGPDLGFDKGFDSFSYHENGNRRAGDSVTELITRLEAENDKPTFALLHLYDAHAPYDPPDHYLRYWAVNRETRRVYWDIDSETGVLNDPERCQHFIDLYDGEIKWIDDELGRLFAWLRDSGRAEETIIIVTSDHGEEFLDHGGIEHSTTLYQELLDIPLIIGGAGIPGGITDSILAAQIDILPTILTLLDEPVPDYVEGIPLLPFSGRLDRFLPSSAVTPDHWHPSGRRNRNWVAVRSDNRKLIWYSDQDSSVVFDLHLDPDEGNPLPADSVLLEEAMYYWSTPALFPHSQSLDLSDETLELLKGLGYI